MSRLAETFARTRAEGRAALIGYLCAGDPTFDASLAACRALVRGGADVLELGMPFSDPLADGLTNQLAAQRALEAGMTTPRCFELAAALRAEFPALPLVFYTYANLVLNPGANAFARDAAQAGADGVLTLDLPPEEAGDVAPALRAHGLDPVYIIAPTTPEARIATICAGAGGFIYYVSREGVTGARDTVAADIPQAVARIRKYTTLPVAVGFGISTPAHVAEVARSADGVIVGSVLVNTVARNAGDTPRLAAELGALAASLAAATRR
jgi:tryptophan synthase alpha chain